ncbi:MAG: extracellular solute-binding protein [Anaerolineae bacterium]|nr:extracellular solute-binding protein [Anaerolineae bacterium]
MSIPTVMPDRRPFLRATLLCVLLLSAVRPLASQDAATQATAPAKLLLWWPELLAPADDPAVRELLNSQLDAFQASQRDVTLELRLKANEGPNGVLATLRAASPVAPGVLPDLALMRRSDMLTAARDGLIQPLDEWITPAMRDDLFPAALELGRTNGQLYGLPWLLSLQHMVWSPQRRDQPPASFAALLEAGTRFAIPAAAPALMNDLLLAQYLAGGGQLPTSTERPEDVDAWLQTLQFYELALAQALLDPAVTGYDATADYVGPLLIGDLDAAVIDSADWLALEAEGASLGYGPIPTMDGSRTATLEGWMWVLVTDSSDRQALATPLLDWMLGNGRRSEFARSVAMLPSRISAWELLEVSPWLDFARELLDNAVLPLASDDEGASVNSARNALMALLSGESDAAGATEDLLRRLAG